MNPGGGYADALDKELLPLNERLISTEEFAQRWRAEATELGHLKVFGPREQGPVEIKTPLASTSLIVIWMYWKLPAKSWPMRYKVSPSYAILMTDLP